MKQNTEHPDVLLIYPKTGADFGSTIAPPHAVLSIAAPLVKEGYKVKVIDMRTDENWQETVLESLKSNPICVGISTMIGTQIRFALKAASLIRGHRNGQIPIVWGGVHPTLLPLQTLENELVDIVVVGEGELTILELVKTLAEKTPLSEVRGIAFKNGGKPVETPPRDLLDIETLPPVPWELVNVEDYVHRDMYVKDSQRTLDIGQTSRGCPFKCGFCCSATIRKRKWRAMSVEKSLDMIASTARRFNLTGIWLRDDEFYINRSRARAICEGMLRENLNIKWYTSGTRVDVFCKADEEDVALLKKAGADVLKFGAESGDNRVLDLMTKDITYEQTLEANRKAKRHGIKPAFALMAGFPTETWEEIDRTIDLAFKLKEENPSAQFESLGTFVALPGTPMYQLAIEHGLKPPKSLEEWIAWNFEEYDYKGRKAPWFSYADRIKLGNLNTLCNLSFAVPNLFDSISNPFMRFVFKTIAIPMSRFYRFRFKHKMYTFSWDLRLIMLLKKALIDSGLLKIK